LKKDNRKFSEPMVKPINWPAISVVIVTKGNHELAEKAARSVMDADYPREKLKIILIEETDTPKPIIDDSVAYHSIPLRNLGVGYARKRAMQSVKSQMVAFTDDDCIVESNWLKQLVKPLMDSKGTAAVAGSVLVPECGSIGKCESILGFPGGGVKYLELSKGNPMEVRTFSTCNCAINRRIIPSIRFKEDLQYGGEDELLSRSISRKYRIIYNPSAIVYHLPRDGFVSVFKWFFRRGQARVEMARHVPDKKIYICHHILTSQLFRMVCLLTICFFFRLSLISTLFVFSFIYYASIIFRFRWAWHYYPSIRIMALLPVIRLLMDIGMEIGSINTLFQKFRSR